MGLNIWLAHSLEAAQQSMVLLKNDGILPLKPKTYKTIAAVGIMNCMSAGCGFVEFEFARFSIRRPFSIVALTLSGACRYDTGFQPVTQGAKKTFTDEALAAAFPDATITSGAGCRCPLGTGTNNEGCEGCPTCLWAPTGGMAMCSNYVGGALPAAFPRSKVTLLTLR